MAKVSRALHKRFPAFRAFLAPALAGAAGFWGRPVGPVGGTHARRSGGSSLSHTQTGKAQAQAQAQAHPRNNTRQTPRAQTATQKTATAVRGD